ncbi:MAG: hypothetical protein AAB607_00600 [Patescibacteria group bacterium]
MKNYKLKLKISVLIFSTFYFLLSAFYLVHAQTPPQFMVSWQANSYAPSWYSGKILPTRGSLIKISFELVDNGKIADLSKKKVRWYVNDKLVQNESKGLGLKFYSFIADDYPGQETEIRITIVDYKDEILDKIVRIPIVFAEAAIDSPYPNAEINTGKNSFLVYPFFFNIRDLNNISFEWLVDNQPAESGENSQSLELNIESAAPSGFEIDIKATIRNLLDEMEFASENIKLVIK